MSRIKSLVYLPLSILFIPFGYRYVVRAAPRTRPHEEIFVAVAHAYMTDPGFVRITSFERKSDLLPEYTDDQFRQDIEQEIRAKGRVY